MDAISGYLRRIARGRHGSEHLTMDEAEQALALLLQPDADALQLGAFLIGQRMKGETAAELAGFVRAVRRGMAEGQSIRAPEGSVDLPCYAGKRRAWPVHLWAAVKAAESGIPVCVHGVAEIPGRLSAWQALAPLGVPRAYSLTEAAEMLIQDGIVYIDLADLAPSLHRLYSMRSRLGVRTFANTVARLLNPLRCSGQLNGVFHPPYVAKMLEANIHLQQPRSLVFMGAEGEPELYASRQKQMASQTGGAIKHWRLEDAGGAVYPRQVRLPEELHAAMQQAIRHGLAPPEQVAFERMLEAFAWASRGIVPSSWQQSMNRGEQ